MTTAAALLRGKLAAILLGTAGVGFLGQVDSFYRGLVQVCILSTGTGVGRCVAGLQARSDEPGIRRALWSILTFSLALAILAVGLVCMLRAELARLVLGDSRYDRFVSVAALGLPLQAVSDAIMGFLIGLRELRTQIWVTAAYTGSSLVVYALLLWEYGLAGGVYSLPAVAASNCAAASWFLLRRHGVWLRFDGERRFDASLLRFILAIGLTGGIMAISDRVVVLALRTVIVRQFGFDANGLYQAVYALSQLSTALAFGFVSTYLVPTLSGSQDAPRARAEFSSALRLTVLIATAVSAGIVLYGKFAIVATYSPAFIGAAPLLRYQAVGDFFRALTLVLSATIFAAAGWKLWFLIGMSFYVAYGLLFRALLPVFGFTAISIAYLFAHLASCGLAVCLFSRAAHIRLFAGQGPLLARSLGLLAVIFVLASSANPALAYACGTGTLLAWAALAFRASEYRRAWVYLCRPAALLGSGTRW